MYMYFLQWKLLSDEQNTICMYHIKTNTHQHPQEKQNKTKEKQKKQFNSVEDQKKKQTNKQTKTKHGGFTKFWKGYDLTHSSLPK